VEGVSIRVQDVIAALGRGERVVGYRESGNSMTPRIRHRQPVTLEPVDASLLERGDVVLVNVRGRIYTHLVSGTREGQVQISNNHGHVNGWTKLENVHGIVTEIDGVEVGRARAKVKA
jgi:hypothetical protein